MTQYQGLNQQQVEENRKKFGSNILISTKKTNRILLSIWEQLKNPIHITLFVASFFAAAFEEVRDAIIIFLMIFLSGTIDILQENRSHNIAQKLTSQLARNCTIIRDGTEKILPIDQVVVDDIVLLHIGDIPPADGILLFGDSLTLNESSLTGESFPAEKKPGDDLFAGTHVLVGWGYMQIKAVGAKTKFGDISSQINKKPSLNAYQKGVSNFSMLILKATAMIVVSVLIINLIKIGFSGEINIEKIFQIMLFSVTIAVGLAPELLPVIISVNMAKGSLAMSKKGILVKKLDAIPDFGSMDILCTDKTGTLTEDNISLIQSLDANGEESSFVFQQACLNSYFQTGLKNPLDKAILDKVKQTNPQNLLSEKLLDKIKIDEIPYDFERKCMSVVVEDKMQNGEIKPENSEKTLITKGQPDEIVKKCSRYQIGDQIFDFSLDIEQKVINQYEELSKKGFRVLAVCTKKIDKNETNFTVKSETNMVLLGLLAFLDPAKKSASLALGELKKYGVSIKIITGDNEYITQKICSDLNLPETKFITGEQFEILKKNSLENPAENQGELESGKSLYQQIISCGIFARFNPHQKQEIIKILQQNHHVVGYMGDGINDVPSLQTADVGISVNNAVDVAKESADIILLQKNLDTLLAGVLEGRKTFNNTIKYMLMAISSNFGNMLSMIGAAIFLPFLPMLPVQILLNNSLYDLSQVAIPTDKVDAEILQKPQVWNINFLQKFMLIFGGISSIFDFAAFFVFYKLLNLPVATFQTAWFLESLATQILVIYIIRTKKVPFIQSRPSILLVINTLLMVVIGIIISTTSLGKSFGFEQLSAQIFIAIAIIILAYLLMVEIAKQLFYKHFR